MNGLTELWSTLKRFLNRALGKGRHASPFVTEEGLVRVPVARNIEPKGAPPHQLAAWRSWMSAVLVAVLVTAVGVAGNGLAAEIDAPQAPLPTAFTKNAPENIDDLRQMQEHIEKLAERLTPVTVHLAIGNAQGSGVIIHKDGYVLTAGHVSGRPGRKVTVTMYDGRQLRGTTLGRNQSLDSGMVKIDEEGDWPVASLGSSDEVKSGDWCLCLGHPGGFDKSRGTVTRLGRILRADDTVVRTDCLLVGGDSGGPLFDMQGRVVGIHSRIAAPTTANFHVPVVTFVKTWERLAASEEWSDTPSGPVIGVRGQDDERGCMVTEAFPGKPAANAGLKVGDIITSFDGREINSLAGLILAVNKRKVGDKVTVEYLRGDEVRTVEMTLVAR